VYFVNDVYVWMVLGVYFVNDVYAGVGGGMMRVCYCGCGDGFSVVCGRCLVFG